MGEVWRQGVAKAAEAGVAASKNSDSGRSRSLPEELRRAITLASGTASAEGGRGGRNPFCSSILSCSFRTLALDGCSTVVFIVCTCPAITVVTVIIRDLDRVRERAFGRWPGRLAAINWAVVFTVVFCEILRENPNKKVNQANF